jgi:hypothetical protein
MSRLLEKGYWWNLGGLLARSCGFSCVARHRGGMGLSVAKQTVDFLGSETGRTCCDITCLTNMFFHIMIWLLVYFWMFLMNVLFPTREMGGFAFHCFFLQLKLDIVMQLNAQTICLLDIVYICTQLNEMNGYCG